MAENKKPQHRYGMVIDLDRCDGCGACMVACAVENNVAPASAEADERKGVTWMRIDKASNGKSFPEHRTVAVPIMCQQCGHHTPCVSVCPQNAVEVDEKSGIVAQIPPRCLGCRYCMTACPYHARYFNWWSPEFPGGTAKTLNPDVAPRMRGVVEKCNFCSNRLQAAKAKAVAEGKNDINPADYVPACVEACPTRAIVFGDLDDASCEAGTLKAAPHTFRLLEQIGTDPKVYYHSDQEWVRTALTRTIPHGAKEAVHG